MINVLIVDDDPMVAELNRRYLEQVDGFRWQGSVSTIQAAKQMLLEGDAPIWCCWISTCRKITGWICCR